MRSSCNRCWLKLVDGGGRGTSYMLSVPITLFQSLVLPNFCSSLSSLSSLFPCRNVMGRHPFCLMCWSAPVPLSASLGCSCHRYFSTILSTAPMFLCMHTTQCSPNVPIVSLRCVVLLRYWGTIFSQGQPQWCLMKREGCCCCRCCCYFFIFLHVLNVREWKRSPLEKVKEGEMKKGKHPEIEESEIRLTLWCLRPASHFWGSLTCLDIFMHFTLVKKHWSQCAICAYIQHKLSTSDLRAEEW